MICISTPAFFIPSLLLTLLPAIRSLERRGRYLFYCMFFVLFFVNDFSTTRGPIHAIFWFRMCLLPFWGLAAPGGLKRRNVECDWRVCVSSTDALLLNSYNAKDAKQRVFLGRLLLALKRAGYVVRWLCKVPFLVQQMFKVMSFCLHACIQPLSPLSNSFNVFLICLPMCH